MLLNYQYKLLPSVEQKARMKSWLDMLRHQYNYLLADRFEWWENNRCPINACSLEHKPYRLREQPEYYGQKRSLVPLKVNRPRYKDIQSQVLQDMVKRVDLAFQRFIKGDCSGKRSGKPRFKGRNRYRTFKFPSLAKEPIQGNTVKLPKIGRVKFIQHRPIPDGFVVKNAQVTLKADGWYLTLCIEDKTVPEQSNEVVPHWDNSIGVDVGLEKFASSSDGDFIDNYRHFRSSANKLAKLQVRASAARNGSKARKKLYGKVARLHQKIARQRKQFHYETSKKLLDRADVVFVEDLKAGNISRRCKPKPSESGGFLPNGQSQKSGLNKSILDAAWGQFIDILSFKAEKAGQKVVKVDPSGTSQYCHACLNRVPKTLAERWHSCPYCGVEIDRDTNAAILIKKVGLGIASLKKAPRVSAQREASILSVG